MTDRVLPKIIFLGFFKVSPSDIEKMKNYQTCQKFGKKFKKLKRPISTTWQFQYPKPQASEISGILDYPRSVTRKKSSKSQCVARCLVSSYWNQGLEGYYYYKDVIRICHAQRSQLISFQQSCSCQRILNQQSNHSKQVDFNLINQRIDLCVFTCYPVYTNHKVCKQKFEKMMLARQ